MVGYTNLAFSIRASSIDTTTQGKNNDRKQAGKITHLLCDEVELVRCPKGSDKEKRITKDLIYVKNETVEGTHGFLNFHEQPKGKRLCIYVALIIETKATQNSISLARI